jgi:FkbM family methyltransferase
VARGEDQAIDQSMALLLAALRPAKREKYLVRALGGDQVSPRAFVAMARRFGVTSVEVPYLDTYRVRLDLGGRSITEEVLACGSFQSALLARFAAAVPDRAPAFINVGANIGTTCLNAHHAGFRDIVAFEPVAANFRLLRENLQQLDGSARLDLRQAAIGAAGGSREIFLNPASTGRHSLVRDFGGGSERVEVRRLDDVAPMRPGVLWIDAEGFEAEILRGGPEYLARHCRAMCLEVTPTLLGPADIDFLDALGQRHFPRVMSQEGAVHARLRDLEAIRNGQQTDVIFLP